MSLPVISPEHARALVASGALLVDIRDADEYAFEHIDGARHIPFDRLQADSAAALRGKTVIFYCLSGLRTSRCGQELAACAAGCEQAFILEGGLQDWRAQRLPTQRAARAVLPLMRQVQIAAGTMILLGVLLGAQIHPAFYALSAFVGAGLVFAGITGFCGLAALLAKMPWNRPLQN
ncbi:MAG: rhodanese family protein [Rhodocyclaceae bacterium]|nr:rhodanese family protein [Rhodocyclaceae bacterium]